MQHIYALLVAGPTDIPGALAYFVYKRCKIEWRSRFEADHARQPTLDEEGEETQVASSLARIESRFDEKKTFKAWMQDIGTAFVSNIGLIVVVGVLAVGYQGMALVSGCTKRALNEVKSLNCAPRAAAHASTPPVVPATGG